MTRRVSFVLGLLALAAATLAQPLTRVRIDAPNAQALADRLKLDLIEASAEIEQQELDVFRRAAVAPFAGDGSPTQANRESAEERLQREFGATRSVARRAVEAALTPENPGNLSLWGIANGLTSVAKQEAWAGSMADLSVQAGRVLSSLQAS